MKILRIDIETYCDLDLTEVGLYRYVDHPSFEILLLGYAYDGGPVQVIDSYSLGNENMCGNVVGYERLLKDLVDPGIMKTAYNAAFERTCLAKYFGLVLPPEQWSCTMVAGMRRGLPAGLAKVAEALGLEQQKMAAGKALIRYFSMPCAPTKANGGRRRNLPHHDPEKWELFKTYCAQDVEVERAISLRLESTHPRWEDELWALDQRINDRGIRLDPLLVASAIAIDEASTQALTQEFQQITAIENPAALGELKDWLSKETGARVESLTKGNIDELIATAKGKARRVLELRKELSKTSTSKYRAMDRCLCSDGRAHGLLQFYGASRTGRWCLTGDHEVLTPDGWVRLDEWSGGKIACWSKLGETVSFQKAIPQEFPFKGDLLSVESQRISQLSTADHRMAYWDNGWQDDTVENIFKFRPAIPFTGVRTTAPALGHDALRVLVMTQADGHYTADGVVRYHFKKVRKIERCRSLLRKCGIAFQESRYEDRAVIAVKSREQPLWLRMFRDKTFGWWLLDESPDVFFDELELWDGYRCGPNSIQYSTTNRMNADVVQAFAHLSGRAASIVVKTRDHEAWRTAYIVNLWLTPGNRNEVRVKPVSVPFTGVVYCPATVTGFFLTRRNGKVWVTGNSGRLIQVQNLPQNKFKDLDLARELALMGDYESLEMVFGAPSFALSQLIRTAFVPDPGKKFVVADFSAIEARVIAWLAGEKWRMDVFATHGKIYEASAAAMFKVPIESIGKGSPLRQKGKIAELALGFGGGPKALQSMDTSNSLDPEELPKLVKMWRNASPKIVKLWRDVEGAVKDVLRRGGRIKLGDYLQVWYANNELLIWLPSGRALVYQSPRLDDDSIIYMGMDQTTNAWCEQRTYGGKLVENIVQATARDCLAMSMLAVEKAGYPIVMHVHDEIICEVDTTVTVEEITDIMGRPLDWAPGLLLRGDGYECSYYRKD